MLIGAVIAVCISCWGVFAWWASWLLKPGLRAGDFEANAAYRVIRTYARLFHRLRIEGVGNIPPRRGCPRPVLFVANHTSGALAEAPQLAEPSFAGGLSPA